MTNVLLLAEPFGYGPAATLLKCRRCLAGLPLRWRYVGPEYTRPLVDPADFDGCAFPGALDSLDSPEVAVARAWADVVLSGTEFRVAGDAAWRGKRLVVFDPLFWFWPEVPPVSVPGMVYLCQNFPGVPDRVAALPPNERGRFVVVAPPRVAVEPAAGRAQVVVNLCGLHNPVRVLADYPRYVLDCLGRALRGTGWESVLVVGNLPPAAAGWVGGEPGRVTVRTLPHAEMIEHMAGAALVLTSPGLNTALEAMAVGVPTLFLPPVNNSQAAQLDRFRAAGLVPVLTDWSSLTGLGRVWDDPNPARSLDGIARCLEACRQSAEYTGRFIEALRRALTLVLTARRELAARQAAFYAGLERGWPTVEEVWAARVLG
ncbi:MAG TPA: hypothetical protein VD866_11595 [Urbifossiella sp.]|nr:hypothetical protein [Urbifossiella sp.]